MVIHAVSGDYKANQFVNLLLSLEVIERKQFCDS
jgi:hypothetical protein